jgi:hypothetical protein
MTTSRKQTDALKTVVTALPAAGANSNSATIDLEVAGDAVRECLEVVISVPAIAALVDTKVITIKLQDSADNITFADVEEFASFTITGTATGGAAASRSFHLPNTVNRYLQINRAVPGDAGTLTASSTTFQLRF